MSTIIITPLGYFRPRSTDKAPLHEPGYRIPRGMYAVNERRADIEARKTTIRQKREKPQE